MSGKPVASVGLGVIGANWVVAFLAAGYRVRAFDQIAETRDTAPQRIGERLALLEAGGRIPSAAEAAARLTICDDLAGAVHGAAYVQESIREVTDEKRALFAAMAAADDGETLYGSSTSSLPGSDFMLGTAIAPRAMVVHPVNPPFAIPLVELCRTEATSDETFDAVGAFLKTTGHKAVLLRRETPGYVLNRLQAAVVGEALHLVAAGVISASDLDAVVSHGLAPRWSLGGPFLTGHLNAPAGYAEYMTRYGQLYRDLLADLDRKHAWTPDDLVEIEAEVRATHPDKSVEQLSHERDLALVRLGQFLEQLEPTRES